MINIASNVYNFKTEMEFRILERLRRDFRNSQPVDEDVKDESPHLSECDPFSGCDAYGDSYTGNW